MGRLQAQDPGEHGRWDLGAELVEGTLVTIPWDRHLAGGGPITYADLRPATRRAYLSAAAAVAEQFTAAEHAARTEGEQH